MELKAERPFPGSGFAVLVGKFVHVERVYVVAGYVKLVDKVGHFRVEAPCGKYDNVLLLLVEALLDPGNDMKDKLELHGLLVRIAPYPEVLVGMLEEILFFYLPDPFAFGLVPEGYETCHVEIEISFHLFLLFDAVVLPKLAKL